MTTKDKPQHKTKSSRPGVIRASVRNFISNDGYLLSAGLAYYGLFSIVPLAILTVSVAGFFLGDTTAEAELTEALTRYVGEDAAALLGRVFDDMSNRGGSTAGTIIGLLLLLYGATRLFLKFQTSFNIMWGVRLREELSVLELLRHRLLTLSLILLPTLVLFVGFLLSTGISWLAGHGWFHWLQRTVEAVGPFSVIWAALATMMVTLPDVRLTLRDSWATSLLAALFCYGTTRAVGAWLAWSSDSTRIVLTSVSVLMTAVVWVNIMTVFLVFSVSMTRALYEAKGKTIKPYEHATQYRVVTEGFRPPQSPTP